jgi:D-alanyl-D-alanine carboxypeptidase
MATTTPNYGWDVPTSTDYVKDGATAIETLGDDIDASLFSITGGKNVGLVLIANNNFTSAASVTLDNVFTSAYSNYKILLTSTGSAAAVHFYRWRTSAPASVTSSNYYINTFGPTNWTSSALVSSAPAVENRGETAYASSGNLTTYTADIFSPQLSEPTFVIGTSASVDEARVKNNFFNLSSSFAGIEIYPQSGTITGSVRIYGYRNS